MDRREAADLKTEIRAIGLSSGRFRLLGGHGGACRGSRRAGQVGLGVCKGVVSDAAACGRG